MSLMNDKPSNPSAVNPSSDIAPLPEQQASEESRKILATQPFAYARPFSVLHRDMWRTIGRDPVSLLVVPIALALCAGVADSWLESRLPGRTNYINRFIHAYILIIIFRGLQLLSYRHRLNPEQLLAASKNSSARKSLTYVLSLILIKPTIAIFALLFFLKNYFPDHDNNDTVFWCIMLFGAIVFAEQLARYAFAAPLVIFENMSAIDALSHSERLTQGRRWRLAGYMTIIISIYLLIPISFILSENLPCEPPREFSFLLLGQIVVSSITSKMHSPNLIDLCPDLFLNVMLSICVGCLPAIFNSIFYIDCRNQKEAWFAAEPIGPPTPGQIPSAVRQGRWGLFFVVTFSLGGFIIIILANFKSRPVTSPAVDSTRLMACGRSQTECEHACAHGDLVACSGLGIVYFHENAQYSDVYKAVDFFRKACHGFEPFGCYKLGTAYENGRGGVKNLQRAAELYQWACENGVSQGCGSLGRLFVSGSGVKADIEMAKSLFQQSCDKDEAENADSCYWLGQARSMTKDKAGARWAFETACRHNFADACKELGELHLVGEGVPVDAGKATKLFKRACELGSAAACRWIMIGTNTREWIQSYQRACEAKNYTACYLLAGLYRRRAAGTPPNAYDLAVGLFKKACEEGVAEACAAF